MNYGPLGPGRCLVSGESPESSLHFSHFIQCAGSEGELANEADNVHGWLSISGTLFRLDTLQ